MRRSLAGPVCALLVAACGVAPPSEEHAARAASAIVGGTESTTAEDFIVYLAWASSEPVKVRGCGASLVAPNLLLTAKHCVKEYQEGVSFCDSSGEPQPGSEGGYTTGDIPLGELKVFRHVDARGQFVRGEEPAAIAKQIIDDKTTTLCSHDLAYVVLDRPIADVPLAKLRLGRRPDAAVDTAIAVAGWGRAEKGPPYNGLFTQIRLKRTGIPLQRVGPPIPDPNIQGALAPKTFETGPGGCSGDSGSPAYDATTGTVTGVLVRALNTDPYHPVSPCTPETVRNVYVVPNDFGPMLREAFAAASAEPWIEGRESGGFVRFGAACTAATECEGGVCAGGTCNVDCAGGAACPQGLVCGDQGACVASKAPSPPPPVAPSDPVTPSSDGCAVTAAPAHRACAEGALIFAACAAFARRIGRRSRLRP